MAEEYIILLMEKVMKDILLMEKDMDMEIMFGQMAHFIMEFGKMIK